MIFKVDLNQNKFGNVMFYDFDFEVLPREDVI